MDARQLVGFMSTVMLIDLLDELMRLPIEQWDANEDSISEAAVICWEAALANEEDKDRLVADLNFVLGEETAEFVIGLYEDQKER